MNGELEAVGTLAEGALVARAVEPNAGDQAVGKRIQEACLNCQTPLIGAHCHVCGQNAHVHRSLAAFGHDILHGVLHFDGKFWRTLPMLIWRPGELTRRYVLGERARFISPMALFLFSIFLMFAIFSFVGAPDFAAENKPAIAVGETGTTIKPGNLAEGMAAEAAKLDADIAGLEKQKSELAMDDPERAALEKQILSRKTDRNAMSLLRGEDPKYPEASLSGNGIIQTDTDGSFDIGMPVVETFVKSLAKKANKNPELLFYKLQSNGYKFAWLLIPLSIPFVWFATLGTRGHALYDHAVFTTYSIAFMCLLFITATLAVKFNILSGPAVAIATVFVPVHMYRQLKQAYQLSRFGALIRLVVLLTSISIITILFLVILVTMGLIG